MGADLDFDAGRAIADATMIVSLKDFLIVWANQRASDLFGCGGEITGKRLSEILPEDVISAINEDQVGGSIRAGTCFSIDLEGRAVELSATFDFFGGGGDSFCHVKLCQLDSCALWSESLEHESGLLSLVLEVGDIGLWSWNARSREMHISDSWFEMTGLASEPVREMLKRLSQSELSEKEQFKHLIDWWAEFVHPDDAAAAKRQIERYLLLRLGTEEGYRNLYRFQHADKTWITIRSQGRAEWQGERLETLNIAQTEVTELAETASNLRSELAELRNSQQKSALTIDEQVMALRAFKVLLVRLIPFAIAVLTPFTSVGENFLSQVYETISQSQEVSAISPRHEED
jgi:PAS domain-containing protein